MILKAQDIVMYDKKHEVYVNKEEIYLTAREYDLLKMLLMKQGEILTATEILNKWEDEKEYNIKTNIVDVYILYLRKKIGSKRIETVRRVGFKIRLAIPK